MAFKFIDEDGKEETIGKPSEKTTEEKPVTAFARGTAEGFAGSHGNTLSLIPGYGEKESESNQPNLLTKLLSLVVRPPAGFSSRPTSSKVSQLLENAGIKKQEESPAEQGLGRWGRGFGSLLSFGTNPLTAAGLSATGAGAAEIGKEAGIGETGQNVLEAIGSLRYKPKAPKPKTEIGQPRLNERGISGQEAGFISPERATQQLNRINSEAAEIASDIGKSSKPFQQISQSIKRGEPIQKRFTQVFTGLEDVAQKFNPKIHLQPLDDFLLKEGGRYAQTGAATELGKFIKDQIQGWQTNGKDNLYNAFRRYRLNNEKIGEIIDSVPRGERLSEFQKKQIGFLGQMNNALDQSFSKSLSSNVPTVAGQTGNQSNLWLKTFQDSNKAYNQYLKTKQANSILNPILEKNVTDKQIETFLNNHKNWDELDKFWGKEETGSLKTLLNDMLRARKGIQSIPKKEVGSEVAKHALLSLIPGLGKVTSLLSIPKVWNWARGRFHSGPKFQKDFHELANALVEQNAEAITSAVSKLGKEEEKPKRKSFFVED